MKLFSIWPNLNPNQQEPTTMRTSDFNIAAVVFMRFDPPSGSFRIQNEKHYFYLNTPQAHLNNLVLVHNGRDFAVAKVVKLLDFNNDVAAVKVTKPLIALIQEHTPEQYNRAAGDINLRQEELVNRRIEASIQQELNPGLIED